MKILKTILHTGTLNAFEVTKKYVFSTSINLFHVAQKLNKNSITISYQGDNNKINVKSEKINFKVGDKVSETRHISQEDVDKFSEMTGDYNPIHSLDHVTRQPIVHGALLNGLVSSLIGTKMPGPGTMVVSQTLNFPSPCYVGEDVNVIVEIVSLRKIISCKFCCTVQREQETTVLHGEAKLIPMKNFYKVE